MTVNRPTIRDVARRSKVSLKTVSRVINNEPSVRERAREHVQRASDELGLVYDNPDPYGVTTAKQATEDIARHAALRLIAELKPAASGDAPVNRGVSAQLVIRDSTARVHKPAA